MKREYKEAIALGIPLLLAFILGKVDSDYLRPLKWYIEIPIFTIIWFVIYMFHVKAVYKVRREDESTETIIQGG